VVHYQPIVELAAGTAIGVEALVRWNHPTRGLLYPADFVDAAERLGMIGDLGEVVLESACNQLVSWRRQGRDLSLAVNVSALQLIDHQFTRRLEAIITRTGIEARHLWLEITETALVEDVAQATVALRAIDALGVRIAIDDFGTGWASLTYLREFPVHALKIDRTFVDGLGCRLRDQAIVRSIIQMGLELGLDVIAEGIETSEQQAALVALGCTTGQGYLFARPAPAETLFDGTGPAWQPLPANSSRLRAHDHGVHLYADDDDLARAVADSFESAIAAGDATLLVATAAHRRAIEGVLAARGIDLARHDHHALDAHTTLDTLLVDGTPDPQRFAEVVATVVTELCATRPGVTIYGELVGILWDRGEVLAALQIENLWNELGSRMSFSLSCGYRNGGQQTLLELEGVCAVHTYVAARSPLATAGAASRGSDVPRTN
jgi:EAL domain-containing protein (putative c-di-GMP-specific phosphodiesterase class I)